MKYDLRLFALTDIAGKATYNPAITEFVNSRAAEMLGHSKEELIDSDTSLIYADQALRDQLVERFGRDGRVRDAEAEFVRSDGSKFWVLLTMERAEWAGEPVRMVWIYDITERKQAEAKLTESENFLRAIIDNIPRVIALKDTSGKYLIHNKRSQRSFELLYGVPDPIGLTVHDIMDKKLADQLAHMDKEVLDCGEVTISESRHQALDGTTYYVETTKFPVTDDRGNFIAIGSHVQDITEKKHDE